MEWYYKGIQEPSTALIWFYPIGEGKFECRVYGSNGWQAITSNQSITDYTELKEALKNKVDVEEGKSLVSDGLITKLSGLKTEDEIEALITTVSTALTAHKNDKNNPHGVTAAQVGLDKVNNTSDADKPVSTAQQTALDKKVDKTTTINGHELSSNINITSTDVGLGNVDNTSDAKKPVSEAQQAALDLKADKQDMIDVLSYGVEWDVTQSTPNLTRVGNLALHKSLPIQNSLKGCIFKDGKVQYYLDSNNWNQKADGSGAANLDGTDGDVMVHHMKFYGKSIINGNKRQVRISVFKIDDTWQEIPEGVIGAYRGTTDQTDAQSIKMRSVVNTTTAFRGGGNRESYDTYLATDPSKSDLGKPRTNLSRATMRTYARNNGVELLYYEAYKWILYWLPVIEYATFHMQRAYNADLTADGYPQGGLGRGVTDCDWGKWSTYNGNYPLTPCGFTNEFGNFSGVKEYTFPTAGDTPTNNTTVQVTRYRGIENPFGDVWTNVDGCILKKDAAGEKRKVYTTSDPTLFSDSDFSKMRLAGEALGIGGYIKEFDLGETAEIIPASTGGGETTCKTDNYWDSDDLSNHTPNFGGCADSGGVAGLGFFVADRGVCIVNSNIGCRTYKVIKS